MYLPILAHPFIEQRAMGNVVNPDNGIANGIDIIETETILLGHERKIFQLLSNLN